MADRENWRGTIVDPPHERNPQASRGDLETRKSPSRSTYLSPLGSSIAMDNPGFSLRAWGVRLDENNLGAFRFLDEFRGGDNS